MESQLFVSFHVWNPVSDDDFETESLEEAMVYYKEGWMVEELHTTFYRPSVFSFTKAEVSFIWNNNPDFGGI
jgi:hypothetical protein